MRKKKRRVLSFILSLAMILGTLFTIPAGTVKAAVPESFEPVEGTAYAIVESTTGKVVQAREKGWGDAAAVHVDGDITNNKVKEKAAFHILKQTDGTYAFASIANEEYLFKCETGIDFIFNWDTTPGENHKFNLEPVEGGYKIKSVSTDSYLGLGTNNRLDKVADENAAIFNFQQIDGMIDEYVSIQNVATQKYVTLGTDQVSLGAIKVTSDTVESDNEKFMPGYWTCDNFTMDSEVVGKKIDVVGLQSKADPSKRIISANWNGSSGDDAIVAKQTTDKSGWEAIAIAPNGDGTVSLRSSYSYRYVTVNDQNELEFCDKTTEELTDAEKFVIYTDIAPSQVKNVKTTPADTNATSVKISWDKIADSIFSGYEVWRSDRADGTYTLVGNADTNSFTDTDLSPDTHYYYQVRAVNGQGTDDNSNPIQTAGDFSDTYEIVTLAGEKPGAPSDIKIADKGDNKAEISWTASETEEEDISYQIYAAPSAYADYTKLEGAETKDTKYTVEYTTGAEGTKWQYYKVVAVNKGIESDLPEEGYVSLEKELFGSNIIIFAETDKTEKIDEIIEATFYKQNDINANAQFNENRYAFYFKPGDYTETACMNLGFYTSFNGLGKTPYEVKLNNVAIPSYLSGDNATCNFWRSMENVSIINTGNEQGKAQFGSWRPEQLNWAVAQAAPLRRVYSERAVAYDWQYGWASGGYVADCYFTGKDGENTAGTWSGQQFYTRNTQTTGNVFGTTLNAFYQGVIAPNLPTEAQDGAWDALQGPAAGVTNWAYSTTGDDGKVNQQVVTSVNATPIIREKPFLFLDDDGEYKIFKPALKEDTRGTSWSENNMGDGEVISLDNFYIAKEGDTAADINAQIAGGKNIFFTPGVYHAEEVINVTGTDRIILGTGMASIIPDNADAAMRVSDDAGITIAGLIFDAGEGSKYLLQVGEEGTHNDHSADPTLLADLFFRIGGTTNKLTKADIGLEINSDDVIGDHFWIWRADHGTGVAWDGNISTNGLIVNGDDVTCYALFDEHFQEYNVLWTGNNGATYFFQNETCYDPQTQEGWMSHQGTVNGFSSYKVANTVESHYAVGLGIYNVFIYTGGSNGQLGDASTVSITLDNAIEVPNSEGVMVENACTQTFASTDGALQKIEHIINGVGQAVSSGVGGEGWSRKFLLRYNNGTAYLGKTANGGAYEGVETVTDVAQPTDDPKAHDMEAADLSKLQELYDANADKKESDYTADSWTAFKTALDNAKAQLDKGENAVQSDVDAAYEALDTAVKGLKAASQPEKADLSKLQKLYDANKGKKESDYTADSWKTFKTALDNAKAQLDKGDKAKQSDVDAAYKALDAAVKGLKAASQPEKVDLSKLQKLYDANKGKKEEVYTAASWKPFKTALDNAKAQLDKGSKAKQSDVDAAYTALDKAAKGLKEKVSRIFDDVAETDWFDPYVQYVYDEGIMTGMRERIFEPATQIPRAQFATILYRMEGSPDVEYKNVFPDVPAGQFYSEAVIWASGSNVGVITGYTGGTYAGYFGPGDLITREQMATMMYRYAKYKGYDLSIDANALDSFPDKNAVSPYASDAMKWAVTHGLIKGDNGNLNPAGFAVRAECATIIQRYMENIAK